MLHRLWDHNAAKTVHNTSLSVKDTYTLFKPLPVATKAEQRLFRLLFQSMAFVKSSGQYVTLISKNGLEEFTRLAKDKSGKKSDGKFLFKAMANWWNVQVWTFHGSGKKLTGLTEVSYPSDDSAAFRRGKPIKLSTGIVSQIALLDGDEIWLKDESLLALHLHTYAQQRIQELAPKTLEGHGMEAPVRTYHANALTEAKTNALPPPRVQTTLSAAAKARLGHEFSVRGTPTIDRPGSSCPLCNKLVKSGCSHKTDCPVKLNFPNGTRKGGNWALSLLDGETKGEAQIRITLANLNSAVGVTSHHKMMVGAQAAGEFNAAANTFTLYS
jgi:hypothetical protein